MKKMLLWTSLAILSGGIAPAQEAGHDRGPAESKAIRAVDQAFVEDYNRGDVRALAARFCEDAEVVDADGIKVQGRPLIERRLAETFAASPGAKLEIAAESIQFLSPDVAREEGHTVVRPRSGTAEIRRHTALLVRRSGQWLLSSLREEPESEVPAHERLKQLEWLIGEWIDQGSDSHIRVKCRWAEDANFLLRTFSVKVQGHEGLTIHQRIGWDPLARQFRSWEFDSSGGYGEGSWSHDGDRWVIRHRGVRPDGAVGAATHIMVRERPDLVRWASLDRSVGDQSIATEQNYVMVRVPPEPQSSTNSAKRGSQ